MRPTRRTGALGVAAALVVVLAVVAQMTAPSGAVPTPEVVPVVSTQLVCPEARGATDGSVRTQVSAVTPSNLATGTIGRAVIGTPTKPAAYATLSGTRRAAAINASAGSIAVVGSAVAGRAPGFAMDQLSVSSRRGDHGLSGATCTEPENDVWFVGTGSAVGHTSTLYLTDTESTPATVDVVMYGKNGRIDAPGGLGLLVPGDGTRIVHLDQLAPGAGSLTVHVTASSGRVGTALFDSEVRGLLPNGSDFLPVSESPHTRAVVPGLGGGQGTRKLTIFAPGEGTATVRVKLVGEQGAFAPTGAASLEIDRGKVTTVDLGTAIAKDNSAAVVESDVPLVAGVRWTTTAGQRDDLAFSAGTSALTAAAVVMGNHIAGGYATSLMLTALDTAAKVSVQPLLDGRPRGAARIVSVGANRTVRIGYPRGFAQGSFGAVITPLAGSGPVWAATVRTRAVDGAAGVTVSVLRNARISVGVPEARSDLDVGLGRSPRRIPRPATRFVRDAVVGCQSS